jgi:uncharacterized membrane protein
MFFDFFWNSTSKLDLVLWGLIPVAALISIIQGLHISSFVNLNGPSLLVTVCAIFVFIHGYRRYGWKSLAVFFGISVVFGMLYENLSIATSFPFGHYYYSDSLGPKFIYAPYILTIAYFQMLYMSWTLAHVVIDNYSNKLKGSYVVVQPVIASFIMVMWDMVIDPHMSTMSGHWVWQNGGAYFGVPFTNYLGWFLCVYTMNQLFALYLAKKGETTTPEVVFKRKFWMQLVILYLTWPLSFLIKGFSIPDSTVTTLDQHAWYVRDLYQTAGLIAIVTMVFIAVLVTIKVLVLNHVPKSDDR